ncbi:uncharacterized protein BXZ73DRAFT_73692 [Epithele typhae]|uniref:uncharacterized protein n=1 Tax=Epithele typhae TaxID=378194 RepID=UPI0020079848|nr:uncharacterized protein BXZ73DRAFT_73692 [Epithele typhae]KAH9944069.1 hypothetical protein BXZ73DRAFT_73692 [Epithele typhae]
MGFLNTSMLWIPLRIIVDMLWWPTSNETPPPPPMIKFDPENVQDDSVVELNKLLPCCTLNTDYKNSKSIDSVKEIWIPVPMNISVLAALHFDMHRQIREGNDINAVGFHLVNPFHVLIPLQFYDDDMNFDYNLVILPRLSQPEDLRSSKDIRLLCAPIPFHPLYHCGIVCAGEELLRLFPDGRFDKTMFSGIDSTVVHNMEAAFMIYKRWITRNPPPRYMSTLSCSRQDNHHHRNDVASGPLLQPHEAKALKRRHSW